MRRREPGRTGPTGGRRRGCRGGTSTVRWRGTVARRRAAVVPAAGARRRCDGLLGAGARARDRCRHPPAPAGSGRALHAAVGQAQPAGAVGRDHAERGRGRRRAAWATPSRRAARCRSCCVLVQPAQLVGQVVLGVRGRRHRRVEQQRGQERSGEDGHAGKDERHSRPGVLRRADDAKSRCGCISCGARAGRGRVGGCSGSGLGAHAALLPVVAWREVVGRGADRARRRGDGRTASAGCARARPRRPPRRRA